LAFRGERVAAAGALTASQAGRMLSARNPHGKPNADVLRPLASAANLHHPGLPWQIDFPAALTEAEASLYELPFQHLRRTLRLDRDRWWVNPHADDRLRTALARRDRYLATPLSANPPEFTWLESSIVPDDTLLVVARDDDFTHGVLQSRPFALWWGLILSRRTPTLAVDSFPFPWPPGTALGALTARQEEQRHAVARAARSGDIERTNSAVVDAYGWPADLGDSELLPRLQGLNHLRAAAGL
jgi:hypothetical protein